MIIEQDPNAAKVARETAGEDGATRRWLGKSINRVEDPRFLRGEGRYIDDIKLPGMAHAAIVRSPTPTRRSSRSAARRPSGSPG